MMGWAFWIGHKFHVKNVHTGQFLERSLQIHVIRAFLFMAIRLCCCDRLRNKSVSERENANLQILAIDENYFLVLLFTVCSSDERKADISEIIWITVKFPKLNMAILISLHFLTICLTCLPLVLTDHFFSTGDEGFLILNGISCWGKK